MVQRLNPRTAKTFLDYAVHVFCHMYLESSTRVVIVWDVLQTNRQQMGKGVRRPVVVSALILKNWKDFL